MSVILTFIVVAAALLWVTAIYNRLIGLRNQVKTAWRRIDGALKRRHDLISNLVNTLRGAMGFERGSLEAVVAAYENARMATGPTDAAEREGVLTEALGRLIARVETDPQLTAQQNVLALQDELMATEKKIGAARQVYNDTATRYNTARRGVPASFVAGFGNFPAAELFEKRISQS